MSLRYRFGSFELDTGTWSLTWGRDPAPLGERGVRLLAVLLESAGSFVSKERLLEEAWPGLIVEDSNLSVQISAIRRVLTRQDAQQGQIETLSRRGYRFSGPVQRLDSPPPSVAASPASPAAHQPSPALNDLLPIHCNRLVGREADLAQLTALINTHRMLTLHGPGGMGKTRLALELAQRVSSDFPDGVTFVLVDENSTMESLTDALAAELRLEGKSGIALLEGVLLFLRQRSTLLIFDNCEAAINAAAALVSRILQAGSGLHVLATSRELLRVQGEHVHPLHALDCPPDGDEPNAVAAMAYGAIRLFVERAQACCPEFVLTNPRVATVSQLCRQLDGSPLAIEMAASRLRVLSLPALLEGLQDRFQLLSRGQRDAPARQQSLRAVLDWSHTLLTADEQACLRRLAVFDGTFRSELARAVISDGLLPADPALDAISSLIDKSLVHREHASDGVISLRLLESTRAYALEKLRLSEDHWVHQRLAEQLYVQLLPGAQAWNTLPTAQWLERYRVSLPTLRGALHWCFDHPAHCQLGVALVSVSAAYWRELSFHREGRQWFELAHQHIDASTPLDVQARIALRLAVDTNYGVRQRYSMACAAIDLCRQLDAPIMLAEGLYSAGRSLINGSDSATAMPLLDEAEHLMRQHAPGKLLASLLIARASAMFFQGGVTEATQGTEEAIQLAEQVGFPQGVERCLSNLAEYAYAAGDAIRAVDLAGQAERSARSSGNLLVLSSTLVNQAGYLIALGRLAEARQSVLEGIRLCHALGDEVFFTHGVEQLALVAARAGNTLVSAQLQGYVDFWYDNAGSFRSHNELVTRQQTTSALARALPTSELERLLGIGRTLDTNGVLHLATQVEQAAYLDNGRTASPRPGTTRTLQ